MFLLFLSFSYSRIESCVKLCFDKIEIFDDIDCETDSEENTSEFEKDQIAPLLSYFEFMYASFLLKNLLSIDFAPSLLTAQYAIDTPPPKKY
jgi:hypothetical protein